MTTMAPEVYAEQKRQHEEAMLFETCIDELRDVDLQCQLDDMIAKLTSILVNDLRIYKNEVTAHNEAACAIARMVYLKINIPRRDVSPMKGRK